MSLFLPQPIHPDLEAIVLDFHHSAYFIDAAIKIWGKILIYHIM